MYGLGIYVKSLIICSQWTNQSNEEGKSLASYLDEHI